MDAACTEDWKPAAASVHRTGKRIPSTWTCTGAERNMASEKTDSRCYISFEKDAWSDSSNRRQAPFIEWWGGGGGRFGSGVHALVLSLWMERACLVTVAKTGVLDMFSVLWVFCGFFCINCVVISMPINRGDEVRWARAVGRRGTWLEGSWMSRVLSEAPMSPLCWPVCVAYWIWKNCIKNQSFLLVAIC